MGALPDDLLTSRKTVGQCGPGFRARTRPMFVAPPGVQTSSCGVFTALCASPVSVNWHPSPAIWLALTSRYSSSPQTPPTALSPKIAEASEREAPPDTLGTLSGRPEVALTFPQWPQKEVGIKGNC